VSGVKEVKYRPYEMHVSYISGNIDVMCLYKLWTIE